MESKLNYRPFFRVPKPSPKVAVEDKNTFFLKEGTKVEFSEEFPDTLFLIHPELSYQESVVELPRARSLIATEPTEIEPSALSLLLRHEVPVVFFSNTGEFLGRLDPKRSKRMDLMQAQFNASEEQRILFAKFVIWGNLRNVRFFLNCRNLDNELVKTNVKIIDESIAQIFNCDTVEQLFGYQGRGLARYYESFETKLVFSGWGFKRNENNPINAMMDFCNQLLEQLAYTALLAAGLNPDIGILHRTGLVHDLCAEYKGVIDAIVVRCINHRRVSLKDFEERWESKFLPPQVARILTESFERRMTERFQYPVLKFPCTYQESLFIQAQQIALFLSGEISEYCPLSWR
jgi:CRISPR-associated protein Cas1